MARRTGALVAVVAAALTQTVSTPASAQAAEPGPKAAETITCDSLGVDGTNVHGQICNTTHWGPLSNVTLKDRNQRSYSCKTGRAEGSLRADGQDCQKS
ncbi:hypothetical protein [Actinomadura oligospora]|uniref:hypothetical protein n=1 Tax=Actinomadura oligospora TaxID=111804 RepID=UPI0004AD0C53|nr:hypothetical protein [Actinomadura oligospora]